MPKGIYQRKPRQPGLKRNVGEESKAAFRRNLEKAKFLPQSTSARKRNAGKACLVRTARLILHKMPLGAEAGSLIRLSRNRTLTMIDRSPVKRLERDAEGKDRTIWEQRFEQSGKITVYGVTREFSGPCRIVWEYEPTLENIFEMPRFEETGKENLKKI